jgi:hypothetical protein
VINDTDYLKNLIEINQITTVPCVFSCINSKNSRTITANFISVMRIQDKNESKKRNFMVAKECFKRRDPKSGEG